MEIRKIKKQEMKKALNLVWNVFLEYEAIDYPQEGIDEFNKCLKDEKWVNEREFFGAFENDEVLGVIATKNKTHIALFFVDGEHHRKGIGRKLYNKVCEENNTNKFTVNSSTYAKKIYEKFGFKCLDGERSVNGMRFYPMVCENIKVNTKTLENI